MIKNPSIPSCQLQGSTPRQVILSPDARARYRNTRRFQRLEEEEQRTLLMLLEGPVEWIDDPVYHEPDADAVFYDRALSVPRPDTSWYQPLMASTVEQSGSRGKGSNRVLTREEEQLLFRQFNLARYRVHEIQEGISAPGPSSAQARNLLRWHAVAESYRHQIVETNLPLVLAMARRAHLNPGDYPELVSDGNVALMRAVNKFDAGRGFKLSTYACKAILKAFSRGGMKLSRYRNRFPLIYEPMMERTDPQGAARALHVQDSAEEVLHVFLNNVADLSSVERTVIEHRFAVGRESSRSPMTLEQVGRIVGLTKERIRQIQLRALGKIKQCIEWRREPCASMSAGYSCN